MKMKRLLLGILLLVSGLAISCGGGSGGGGSSPQVKSRQVLNADGSLQVDFAATADTFADAADLKYRHTVYEGESELSPQLGFSRYDLALDPSQLYALSAGGTLYVGGSMQRPVLYFLGGGEAVTLRICTEADNTHGVVTKSQCQAIIVEPMSALDNSPARIASRQVLNADNSLTVDFSATAQCFASAGELEYRHTVYEGDTALPPQLGFTRHDTAIGDFQTYDLSGGGMLFVGGSYQQPVFYYVGGGPSVTLRLCSEADDTHGIVTAVRCQSLELSQVTDLTDLSIYAVRVSVTDLDGALTLQNNGGDDLAVAADGTHTFTTRLAPGAGYAVAVSSLVGENYFQECRVTGGSGTIGHADVTVSVDCPEPLVIGRRKILNGMVLPWGSTTDSDGNVYVAQSTAQYVTKHNSAGHLVLLVEGAVVGDAAAANLRDVALDSSLNIYVADSANHSIKVFNAAGTYLRQFGASGSGDGQFNTPMGIFIDASDRVYVTDQLNHRVQMFDSSGSFLRKFGSNGAGNGQFNTPNKLWVDGTGKIYVADTTNNRIQVFDNNGGFLLKFGTSGAGNGQFNQPYGVAVAANGNIYTAEYNGRRVQIFDSNGNYLSKFATGTGYGDNDLQRLTDIHIDADGDIVVNDYMFNFRIHKFTAAGTHLASIQNHGSASGEFLLAEFIAVDASQVYVTDTNNNRVQVFDRQGELVRVIGSTGSGDGQFSGPFGIDVDSQGRIYVSESGNDRVQVFDSSGNYLFKFGSNGSGNGQFLYPFGLAIAGNGNIIVADYSRNDVQIFDSSGNYLTKFGSVGSGDGQFNHPLDVAVFSNGNIAVTDQNNHRVQIFDSSGNFLSKFGSNGTGDGQFGQPYGIHIDANDRMYVVEYNNDRLQVFDQAGTFLYKFGSTGNRPGRFNQPGGVAISPELDQIWVLDYWTHYAYALDMQGNNIYQ